MKFAQLTEILNKTGLSPEELSGYLQVSNMTYRRWLKRDGGDDVPDEYLRNITGGIYGLVAEGKLDPALPAVAGFLGARVPEFFHAVAGNLGFTAENTGAGATQEDKVVRALANLGASDNIRDGIDREHKKITAFARMGEEWKSRITGLIGVLKSREMDARDKWVAYGAFFYLLTPFDLVPDAIPVVGYIDDFAILGFAMAYYTRIQSGFITAKTRRS